jgi:hypothetical protein
MLVFIFSYSKKARVEAMYYFHDKADVKSLILESSSTNRSVNLPRFYMNHKWARTFTVEEGKPIEILKMELTFVPIKNRPNYILFLDEKKLNERVESMKSIFPSLTLVYTSTPSLLDWILYKMNPVNANQVIYIYKVKE